MGSKRTFIGQKIHVGYDEEVVIARKPNCPSFFTWGHHMHRIECVEMEWKDFFRKGRAGRNMRPAHHERAQNNGSWGVGRYYFRVHTKCGRLFDIYYDRTPSKQKDHQGGWFLFCEWLKDSE